MPSYKTHDTIALISAPVITLGASAYTDHALLFGAAFIIGNHMLSPDLDTDSIMRVRWGAFYFLWYPYRRMFHHRSFFTHSGPISATIRIIYLLFVLLPLLLFILNYDMIYFIQQHETELYICYAAVCLSDLLHTGVDFFDYIRKIPYRFWKNTFRTSEKAERRTW